MFVHICRKLSKKAIQDKQLFVVVAVLVAVELVFLAIWHFIDPLESIVEYGPLSQSVDPNRMSRTATLVCKSENTTAWLGATYGLKVINMKKKF